MVKFGRGWGGGGGAVEAWCTVGFMIFPYIVALVHTAPYVVQYHHYCRRTLAKVPRHFYFFHFVLANAIFTNIDTMGVVGHGLSTAAHGRKTPVPAQCTRSPHNGRRRLSSFFCDSSWEGKKYSTSARAICGVFAVTQQSNRQGLYRRPWPEDARSFATHAIPTSWATTADLGFL